ncbi:hypothetical protein NMG60_11024403 [Bertholletia excelsa]
MKIQCDACNKKEASVFCSADEAALCDACDHRVHHANKLAGKHLRFSLLSPSPKHFPRCDICQKRRAFLFCQEDRAILCRECDLPIHKANEHTQKHNRFLLTGAKLSAANSMSSSTVTTGGCTDSPNLTPQSSVNKPGSIQPAVHDAPAPALASGNCIADSQLNAGDDGSKSSISEYLIETLPGWCVDDFLGSSPANFPFCKTLDDERPIWDANLVSNLGSFSSPENAGLWVPHAPPPPLCSPQYYPFADIGQIGMKETRGASDKNSKKNCRHDGSFMVPQLSSPSKKPRSFWL